MTIVSISQMWKQGQKKKKKPAIKGQNAVKRGESKFCGSLQNCPQAGMPQEKRHWIKLPGSLPWEPRVPVPPQCCLWDWMWKVGCHVCAKWGWTPAWIEWAAQRTWAPAVRLTGEALPSFEKTHTFERTAMIMMNLTKQFHFAQGYLPCLLSCRMLCVA